MPMTTSDARKRLAEARQNSDAGKPPAATTVPPRGAVEPDDPTSVEPASDPAVELDLLGSPAEDMLRTAAISPDGLYRYTLNRIWGRADRLLPWIMLNPSTADAEIDDPTIRRCITFTRDWGFDGITIANLYALRSTDPKRLWVAADPVGPRNDGILRELFAAALRRGLPVIAAWGANAKPERVAAVRAMAAPGQLYHLGLTKDGQPRHPLYLPKFTTPMLWGGES